jgi:hypothetical protein
MLVSYDFYCLSGLFSWGWVRDHKRKTKRLSFIDELHGLRTSVRKETPTRPEPNLIEPHLTQFKSERSMLKMNYNQWFAKFQPEHSKMQIQIKLPATNWRYIFWLLRVIYVYFRDFPPRRVLNNFIIRFFLLFIPLFWGLYMLTML